MTTRERILLAAHDLPPARLAAVADLLEGAASLDERELDEVLVHVRALGRRRQLEATTAAADRSGL